MKEYEIVAFPTVSLESIFTTLLIDEKDGQDVATFDVQGAFLHPDLPEGQSLFYAYEMNAKRKAHWIITRKH